MSTTGIPAFDSTLQTTNIWLHDVMERLGWHDKQHAYHALRVVLHALRDHLPVDQAAALGAQLPMLIRGFYFEGWHTASRPVKKRRREDFLAPIENAFRDELNVSAVEIASAVLAVLAKHVSPGEIKHVKLTLPAAIRGLWSPESQTVWF